MAQQVGSRAGGLVVSHGPALPRKVQTCGHAEARDIDQCESLLLLLCSAYALAMIHPEVLEARNTAGGT